MAKTEHVNAEKRIKMAFFYKHKPRKFNYIPRYYDPDKEAWEKKKAELNEELEAYKKYRKQLNDTILKIISSGGIKIQWDMN